MKLNLPILIKLIILASIGRSSSSPVQKVFQAVRKIFQIEKCSDYKNITSVIDGHFLNCGELKNETVKYYEDNLPYMCLLTLNMAITFCKTKNNGELKYLNENITNEKPKLFCPIFYSFSLDHLGVLHKYVNDNLAIVKNNLRSENECPILCNITEKSKYYCLLMWHLIEAMKMTNVETSSKNGLQNAETKPSSKEVIVNNQEILQEKSSTPGEKQLDEPKLRENGNTYDGQLAIGNIEESDQTGLKSVDENLNNESNTAIDSKIIKTTNINENVHIDDASADLMETVSHQDLNSNKKVNSKGDDDIPEKLQCTTENTGEQCKTNKKDNSDNFIKHGLENLNKHNVASTAKNSNINNNINEKNNINSDNNAKYFNKKTFKQDNINFQKNNEHVNILIPDSKVGSSKDDGQANFQGVKDQSDTYLHTKEGYESNVEDSIQPDGKDKVYVTYGLKESSIEDEDAKINTGPSEKISAELKEKKVQSDQETQYAKSSYSHEFYNADSFFQTEDSHFSAYFLMTISIIIIGYIIYHNKNKIVAYALEGRRSRNSRRRPHSASYRKLDCNLEEAIASNPSHASVTNVVY